jgi:hypothetical protein
MPLPLLDCAESAPPCCSTLHMLATHLLDVVVPGQIECASEQPCPNKELVAYVQHGTDFDDPLCDSLVVFLTSITSSPGSTSINGTTVLAPVFRASYRVRLRESGWPMVEDDGDTIYVPDPQLVHRQSVHSYAHGERMFRDLANAHAHKRLVPSGCSVVRIGDFLPLFTSGGCVGWEIEITVDVPWSLNLGGY